MGCGGGHLGLVKGDGWSKTPKKGLLTRNPAETDEKCEFMVRQTWDRHVGGGQGHLLHVNAPKKHLRL